MVFLIFELLPLVISQTSPFYYGLNLVRNKADNTVRRGAVVKALAVFSSYSFLEVLACLFSCCCFCAFFSCNSVLCYFMLCYVMQALKSLLVVAMDQYFENPSLDTLTQFFQSMNSLNVSEIPFPNMAECCLMKRRSSFAAHTSEEEDPWVC